MVIFSIFTPMDRRTALIAIGQCRLLAAKGAPKFRASGELLKGGRSTVHPWGFGSHSALGDNAVTARNRACQGQPYGRRTYSLLLWISLFWEP